jgi:hypothetical protein
MFAVAAVTRSRLDPRGAAIAARGPTGGDWQPLTEALEAAADAFERTGGLLLAVEAFADTSRSWRRVGDPR